MKVIVDKVFPFAQMADALAYVESGRAKGNVVAEMGCGSVVKIAPSIARPATTS